MAETAIEWTDAVWNPTVGCTRISAGCKECYAFALHDMRHAAFKAGKKLPAQYAKPFTELQLMEDRLTDPLHWRKPRRVFVNSVSDLFHKDVPELFLDRAFAVMALARQHTFQVLTKRADRMAAYMNAPNRKQMIAAQTMEISDEMAAIAGTHTARIKLDDFSAAFKGSGPLPNVWLGVSVENQEQADGRIPHLLATPAGVRFLSCEPLLGPVDLTKLWLKDRSGYWNALTGKLTCKITLNAGGEAWGETEDAITGRIGWVIVGGESGPGARPMHPDWARSLRDQCEAAGVPFFFKQWGEFGEGYAGMPRREAHAFRQTGWNGVEPIVYRVGKKAAGRLLDGREWSEFPKVGARQP